jgi:hypothetical protein
VHGVAAQIVRCRPRIERRSIDVHPDARFHHVDDEQPEEERECGDDFEVEQRQQTGAADGLTSRIPLMPPTTVQKMIGPAIIRTSLMKAVAERLHRNAGVVMEVPEQHAEAGGDEDLAVQGRAYAAQHRRE